MRLHGICRSWYGDAEADRTAAILCEQRLQTHFRSLIQLSPPSSHLLFVYFPFKGINNFDPVLVRNIALAAEAGGASHIDIACDAELVRIAKSATSLPVCVSSVTLFP